MESSNLLSNDEINGLMDILKNRFENNMNRHPKIKWSDVESNLVSNKAKLASIGKMENTGGEPDVIDYIKETNKYVFYDCSAQSPVGRRNVCYDQDALNSRKNNKPKNSAISLSNEIGIEILDENEYRKLQELGEFDTKTSSWIKTPSSIRNLGGAVFCDRRYNTVFTYHNGAESYYSARGFRGKIEI